FVFFVNASGNIELAMGDGDAFLTVAMGNDSLVAGVWYHVAAVYTGIDTSSNVTLYLNGVQDGTIGTFDPEFRQDSTAPTLIGRTVINGDVYTFNGALGEVTIWETPQSQSDIADRYSDGTLSSLDSNGLIASFQFTEGVQSFLHDASGNGYGAT